jgi:crotonobetainyl-CoA:carnitine CoA-transferase CaiB-like acyl-CoA transferase
MQPLKGTRIVTLALNVPGPVAVARLVELGAEAVKIEPPGGDPLKTAAPAWYDSLSQGQTVVSLDLKNEEDRSRLDHFLADAQLLLTSFRPSALQRLKLDWESLRPGFPRLCVVNIVGYPSPDEEIPGHDLTYQASLGLLRPPQMPITLHADMAGAERAANICLALLLNRARTGHTDHACVSLYEAMRDFARPLTAGLTQPGGVLGGGFAFYGIYQSSDGWIAVGALEPRFINRLTSELNLTTNARADLERIFRTRSSNEWEQWANERDLPISAVQNIGYR